MSRTVYPNLERAVKERNIPFSRLAREIGMTKSAMYRRLSGSAEWKLHEVVLVCQFLGTEDAIQLFLR